MIHVSINCIDGSLQESDEDDSFVERLYQLKKQGYKGKALVNELFTDDWGAPPLNVKITGNTSTGKEINEQITYR